MKLLIKHLESMGNEYQISSSDGTVYESENYSKIHSVKVVDTDMYCYEDKYYYKKDEVLEVDEVSYDTSVYVDVTKYVNEIMRSKTDHLTQLPNRTQLENYLSKVDNECVVVMSDIDDFKKINDVYGHQAGDSIIRLIGDLMRCMIDKDAFAGRYGGEEFLIVFNTDNVHKVKRTMDQFNDFLNKYTKQLSISVSTGIYKFDPKTQEPISDAIKKADQALYYVKKHGKKASKIYEDINEK